MHMLFNSDSLGVRIHHVNDLPTAAPGDALIYLQVPDMYICTQYEACLLALHVAVLLRAHAFAYA